MDLQADLATRWRPSDEQIAEAERYLAEHPDADECYTAHVLVNKEWGFWTEDVQIVHVTGVYRTRAGAEAAADFHRIQGDVPTIGGYARHSRVGADIAAAAGLPTPYVWAVWESF